MDQCLIQPSSEKLPLALDGNVHVSEIYKRYWNNTIGWGAVSCIPTNDSHSYRCKQPLLLSFGAQALYACLVYQPPCPWRLGSSHPPHGRGADYTSGGSGWLGRWLSRSVSLLGHESRLD